MRIFKVPVVYLSVLSALAFALAFAYNMSSEVPLSLIFEPGTSIILFALAVMGISFLFFGYGSPIMMVFSGLYSGMLWVQGNIIMSVSAAIISVFVAYASIRLGVSLLHDLQDKENFKTVWQPVSMIVSIVLIFAVILEFVL